MSIFSKIFGDANQRLIKELQLVVDQINGFESKVRELSDEALKAKTQEFKQRLADGTTLDELLPEAFAVVREASRRTLGQRHYDVQLMGGMILHRGKIAEMRTGEGKTLVATLAAYLNALTGKGVHVVTVNDYLARRDAVWMGQIYYALGLSIACINHDVSYLYDPSQIKHKELAADDQSADAEAMADKRRDETGSFHVEHEFLRPIERREAYAADITYGTNNEFGFDYLRDNMVFDQSQMVQVQGHNFAIVDEIDSILIDEARTPLIISAPDIDSGELYQTFARIVPHLQAETDYTIDEKRKAVSITEQGIEKVEKMLKVKNIYEEQGIQYVHHLEEALKAHILFHRDKDYVVRNGEIIIVDEFTGRLMPGRRWSGGLHQSVEAKEKVQIQKESKTLASITFQNYFRLYSKLSGMTGTAQTSAEEFHKVYNLDVVTVPTNKPTIRQDLPDRIYKTEQGKIQAIVREVKERHQQGQPVLIGTVSIAKNEILSAYLNREGVPHKILNAKNHEQEGEIIAQAGRHGAVTVATNMAGRGVDIILGGNPPLPDEAERVRGVGGLHVIGTERHEARRIDNQLRGRAGRQGDPGSSQFFVSTEDDLARVFGGERLKGLMDRLGVPEDEAIEHRFVSSAIEQAQAKIEGYNFDARKNVLDYDDVMNRHRETIYQLRRQAVMADSIHDIIRDYVYRELDQIADYSLSQPGMVESEDSANAPDSNTMTLSALSAIFASVDDIEAKLQEITDPVELKDYLHTRADEAFKQKVQEFGADTMRHLEKAVLLRVIDELWVDHLEQMEHLGQAVSLRALGQRDPLVEYKIEGQKLFIQLQDAIGSQVAHLIFKITANVQPQQRKHVIYAKPEAVSITNAQSANDLQTSSQPSQSQSQSQSQSFSQSIASSEPKLGLPTEALAKVGRNDPCPCGSGKKYKKCGLMNTEEHQRLMVQKK